MNPTRTKRLMLVELFIFFTLAGTAGLIFQPLMALINRHITVVREEMVKQVETLLNRPIRYSSMSPSLIGTVEIRDLVVGNGQTPLASVDHLYLEYSLWNLVRGKGIEAVKSLVLERPEFFYDAGRDGDLRTLFAGDSSGKTKKITLPSKCLLIVRNGIVSFTRGKLSFSVADVSLSGEIQEQRVRLEGKWWKNPSFGGAEKDIEEEAVTMEGSLNGSFSRQLNQGNIAINIDSVTGNGFAVNRNNFDISFFEDRIIFEREDDGLPLKFSSVYLSKTSELYGSFFTDSFFPASLMRFYGPLERFSPVLEMSLSGKFQFSQGKPNENQTAGNDFLYNFTLTGEGPNRVQASPLRSFIFVGNGNKEHLTFSQFNILANRGSVRYSGDISFDPLIPEGLLVFSGFSITGDNRVDGELSFSRIREGFALNSRFLFFDETGFSFDGEFIQNTGGGGYSFGMRSWGGRSSFESRGSFVKETNHLEGTAEITNFYVSDFINIARPFFSVGSSLDNSARKTVVNTGIDFTTDFGSFRFSTRNFKTAYGTDAVLFASIEGTEKRITVNDGSLEWGQEEILFDLGADFSNLNDLQFEGNFAFRDFVYSLEGNFQNRNVLSLRGAHEFSATMREQEGQWSGFVQSRNVPIPYMGRRAYLNLDLAFIYNSQNAWNVALNHLEIREAATKTEILVRGQASQHGLSLDRIYYRDQFGPMEGSAAAVWNRNFSVIDGSFFISDEDEIEKLAGDLFYESGMLEFHGIAAALNVDRIAGSGKNLMLSGEFYGGTNRDGFYSAALNLTSFTGRNGQTPFSVSGHALLDSEQLLLSQIFLSASDMHAVIPFISVDRNAGRLETEAEIAGQINDQELGLFLSMGVNFCPIESWLDLKHSTDTLSGILDVRYAFINEEETKEPFSFTFTRTSSEEEGKTGLSVFRLSGGPNAMLNAEYQENLSNEGTFFLSLANPSPVQGYITGVLNGTTIDALASEVFIDLPGLWSIIPINKVVNFTGGFITGETRIYGSIFDPEFSGVAWGSGVTLIVPEYIQNEIGPGSDAIILEGSEISFGPVAANCGSGGGFVSGWFRFNRWIPSFGVDIEVDRGIPFDLNISGVMAKGNAAGNISFIMEEKETLIITGEVEAANTEITLNTEEIEKAMAGIGSASDLEIITDVNITARRRVEFLWPTAKTPLLRAYGETVNGVRIRGNTSTPYLSMDGEVILRGGDLYYLQRSFFIREGQLRFSSLDPQIDPRISARAEIRDRNEDGPVTIAMVVDNIPLSELQRSTPRFESTPSLSMFEIYSLLGQAPPLGAEAAATGTPNVVFADATGILLQSIVFRPLEQALRNMLGLDMFSFRTQILQNAVFEAARNREPEEQPATIGNYLDNTAVFIGKYIGPDLFLQANLFFRYDQYRDEYRGMKVEPEIGLDFRTPLFDIRWSVRPLRPENLYAGDFIRDYVSNQSISLVWHWSL